MTNSGDIIITRNTSEVGNDSPGYWNHAAISGGDYIIEAQAKPNLVIAVNPEAFFLRYPEYKIFRYFDEQISYQAALVAHSLLGKPYRKLASIFMFWKKTTLGENCVSVVRKAWSHALHLDTGWRRPDHINNMIIPGFSAIKHHIDYINWTPQSSLGQL